MLIKRKDIEDYSSNEDNEMDYGADMKSFKTPVSDRIRLESTSVLYSKSVYPLSLGIHDEYWFLSYIFIISKLCH